MSTPEYVIQGQDSRVRHAAVRELYPASPRYVGPPRYVLRAVCGNTPGVHFDCTTWTNMPVTCARCVAILARG